MTFGQFKGTRHPAMMQKKAKVKISKTKTKKAKKAKRERATKGRKSLIPSRCGRILRTWVLRQTVFVVRRVTSVR
jgi:hypothetical protein